MVRVHPSLLNGGSNRWQFPAAFVLLLVLLVTTIVRGPKQVVIAKTTAAPPPAIKQIAVLIAKRKLEAGVPFDMAAIALEQRPANTLPADAISSFEDLEDKVAAGPIPAGYPLARALVVEAVQELPASEEQEQVEQEMDPLDLLLEEIKQKTVAVPIGFKSTAPVRGRRVALALSSVQGDTVLVLDEAWVSESSGTRATLRIEPQKALFLQSARKLGAFSFIEIPTEGDSPYAGHSVKDMEALEMALGLKTVGKKRKIKVEKSGANRRFRSYAWIRGTGQRYGIDEKGLMYLVDSSGREIGPVLKDMD